MIIASVQENQCYLAELLENNPGLYTICEKWKLPNEININKFKKCFITIIKMSEKLKREFYFNDESILCCRKTKDERLTDDFIWNISEIDFDMLQGPLIRGGIYTCDKQNIFKLQFHHTLMDAWSLGLFISDLWKLYHGENPIHEYKYPQLYNYGNACNTKQIIQKKWQNFKFLSIPKSSNASGTILSINNESLNALKSAAISKKITFFSLLVCKISQAISAIEPLEKLEFGVPFSSRDSSNFNEIGMIVDTQLLCIDNQLGELEFYKETNNKVLNLMQNKNPITQYRGMPKIMINFLDLSSLNLDFPKNNYPISSIPKYALFDLQIEFRNKHDSMDIIVAHKEGVLSQEHQYFFYERLNVCFK